MTPPRLLRGACAALSIAASLAAGSSALAVEPWSDPDPPSEPTRYALGDFGLRGGAEYRAQFLHVNPIALSSDTARQVSWIEHRLRLDLGADYHDKVRLVASADVLDGVLWGDNGTFTDEPKSNAGTNVNVKNPNVTRPCVGYLGTGDPLQASSYGYAVCPGNVITVRKAYGEVVLPIGLLRVGRQPVNIGTGVQSADGDGRPNRFGVSRTGNLADRVLFATKPLEAFKPKGERNLSPDEGLIVAFAYDRLVTDAPQVPTAAVNQVAAALRFGAPRHAFGSDLLVGAYYVHRWDTQFATQIHSMGLRAFSRFGPVQAGFDVAANVGTTREIAAAYKVITNDPVIDQTVRQVGARAVVRYDHKYFSVYFESDYASGDGDPQNRTPLTQFTFSEDTNVGLLLFEHVLAFQTARAAAAGVETLRRLGAPSYPAEAINTRGSFTNAFAIFPQFDVRPLPGLLLRGGVLVAWAPQFVVDPAQSLQRRDGLTIKDDLVNFVGGKPARFYGTEIDGRVQYRFLEHFLLDLEGAILFPGDALKDQDGYAVRSGLFQARTTFFF